jgi:hypothetical protein
LENREGGCFLGVEMNAELQKAPQESQAPELVPAAAIARRLSVSPRYIHLLAEQGKIPVCRFGRGCVRFNPAAVYRALGINTETGKVGA